MVNLTHEAKEALVAKALSRGKIGLKEFADQHGIGYSTLQKWLRLQRAGLPLPGERRGRPLQGQTPPLQHLLATAKLDEAAVGAYCREHGIHSFQLAQWETELMKNETNKQRSDDVRKEINSLRRQLKTLKKELSRKDKALAETTALLVLKKKANLIWGAAEDD
jgi:transposase-like protein